MIANVCAAQTIWKFTLKKKVQERQMKSRKINTL